MKFSILFWNLWVYNQIEAEARADRLFGELKRLVDEYQPDFIALNEAVQSHDGGPVPVLEYLKKFGYTHNHHANMGRFKNYWLSGAALCSKLKLNEPQKIVISKHGFAAKRGYSNLYKEAISVHMALPAGRDLKVIVAHPLATIDAFEDHFVATKKLNQLVHSKAYAENTILVGDMNEWRLIPGALRAKVSDVMHSRTGSLLNPTWRYNAHRWTPLRLNLDYVYWSKRSDFDLKGFKVLSSTVSDHRPLLATFEYE